MVLSQLEKNKLRKAFKVFDDDDSGHLTVDEMVNIFTREGGGAPLPETVAKALIDEFDKDGNGKLDVEEFIECWSMIGEAGKEGKLTSEEDLETNKYYDRPFQKFKKEITELFELLDTDDSGFIELAEMKEVCTLHHGEKFDEEAYLGWYDSNHAAGQKSDGKFDLKEFGWYIVDCAECDESKMPDEMTRFKESIECCNDKKKRDKQKTTKDLFADVDTVKK